MPRKTIKQLEDVIKEKDDEIFTLRHTVLSLIRNFVVDNLSANDFFMFIDTEYMTLKQWAEKQENNPFKHRQWGITKKEDLSDKRK